MPNPAPPVPDDGDDSDKVGSSTVKSAAAVIQPEGPDSVADIIKTPPSVESDPTHVAAYTTCVMGMEIVTCEQCKHPYKVFATLNVTAAQADPLILNALHRRGGHGHPSGN